MALLSSGSEVFNDLLEGGFEPEVITTLYGSSGSGKTNVALLAALSTADKGKVIFIDSEGGLSTARARQLFQDADRRIKNLVISKPTSFADQKKIFDYLEEVAKREKVSLIVVDSISMLYRLELGGGGAYEVNKELARQLGILRKLSHDLHIPIILTNQVYADFEKKGEVRMVGGDLMKYFSKCIIRLDTIDAKTRKAELVKHRSLPPREVFFEICNEGLVATEKKEKRFSLF